MSVEHGPSRLARSQCDGCGQLCLDEELSGALPSMPEMRYCADCEIEVRAAILADLDDTVQGESDAIATEERRAEPGDAAVQYEPRAAF